MGPAILCLVLSSSGAAYHYKNELKQLYKERTKDTPTEFRQTAAKHLVTNGDLTVSVMESGTVQAVKSIQIASEVEGQARIISIIPEGSRVKKGELLIELDASQFEDQINQQTISLESAKASLTEARESLAIQENQNQSDIKAGQLKIRFANIDQKKYIEGDWPQKNRSAEAEITITKEELERARDRLKWTAKLEKEGFVTRSELQADQLVVKKAELKHDQSKETLRILEKYEYPKRLEELQASLDESEHELGRIKHKARAQILQKDAALRAKQATCALQEQKLEKLQEQKKKCRIAAPAPGLVVYFSERSRHGSSQSQIEEGAMVRQRQKIITLPDVSIMRVDVKVHESAVDKVRKNQKTYITVDALPGKRFVGHVKSVGLVPDSQSFWLNPDLKVYNTEVIIDSEVSELKPGMTASVEIIVAELKDVLTVPVQAVVSRQGLPSCYVPAGDHIEMRAVRVGMANEQYVVIKEGVEIGEQVLLFEPEPGILVDPIGFDTIQSGPETVAVAKDRKIDSENATEAVGDHPGRGVASRQGRHPPGGGQSGSWRERANTAAPSGGSEGRRPWENRGEGHDGGEGRPGGGGSWQERMQNMSAEERAAMQKRIEERMKNMTPEQREQMQKRFGSSGRSKEQKPSGE